MERIELSEQSEEYIEYTVIHEDGSVGSASLTVRELEGHHIAYHVRGENLPTRSRVAELFLYPHSKSSSEREGVGSRVLDYILKDAANRNIKLVFCEATDLVAKNFFRKKGFKGSYDPHCYAVV